MRVLKSVSNRRILQLLLGSLVAAGAGVTAAPVVAGQASSTPSRYLVQAASLSVAEADVQRVGGKVERRLDVIHAVSAYLDASQAARLRALPAVRLFADRKLHTQGLGSLLGSLTAPLQNTLNTVNSTVATNPVVTTVTSVTTPLTATVTQVASPVLSPVIGPVVGALSSSTNLQDGKGVAALTLLYQTNYPMLVGADKLQQRGITGRGVTIAMLDTGLWQDATQM